MKGPNKLLKLKLNGKIRGMAEHRFGNAYNKKHLTEEWHGCHSKKKMKIQDWIGVEP